MKIAVNPTAIIPEAYYNVQPQNENIKFAELKYRAESHEQSYNTTRNMSNEKLEVNSRTSARFWWIK